MRLKVTASRASSSREAPGSSRVASEAEEPRPEAIAAAVCVIRSTGRSARPARNQPPTAARADRRRSAPIDSSRRTASSVWLSWISGSPTLIAPIVRRDGLRTSGKWTVRICDAVQLDRREHRLGRTRRRRPARQRALAQVLGRELDGAPLVDDLDEQAGEGVDLRRRHLDPDLTRSPG